MTIMLVGGGSGGHITPLLAVAHELKKQNPDIRIIYAGEKGGKFAHLISGASDVIDVVSYIRAGKLRRYPNESKLKRALDVKTHVLNARDLFYTAAGLNQAKNMLKKYRPDIVFIKGGFIAVPVGKACALLGVPYITHDSDTVPGLANRLIAKKAKLNLVGMPEQFYDYPKTKLRYVGIPLSPQYHAVTHEDKLVARRTLAIDTDSIVLFVTGGSLGAQRLNELMVSCINTLLTSIDNLIVIHQTGTGKGNIYTGLTSDLKKRVIEYEYINDMHNYSAAADVVVARAGATTIYELAMQQKACVLVPSIYLAGSHQLQNANYFASKKAILNIDESEQNASETFTSLLLSLLKNNKKRETLGQKFGSLIHRQAAKEIATILIDKAQGR